MSLGSTSGSGRFRSALVVVGLTLTVASTYVVIELVAVGSMTWMLGRPDVMGTLLLSEATRTSTTCDAPPVGNTPPAAGPPLAARQASWQLGLRLGMDAVGRQYTDPASDALLEGVRGMRDIATLLAVPAPEVFVPQQLANANTEFVAFVEADASRTGRQVAALHGTEACRLYKLGAFWGYASLVRPALAGNRAIFAAELQHYASRTGLPASLWTPMLAASSADASQEAIARETVAITMQVNDALLQGGNRAP